MSIAQPARSLPIEELRAPTQRMLVALGEDTEREGLVHTPTRVAESLTYLTDGYGVDPRQVVGSALYEHEGDDLVTVRDIPFYTLCEQPPLPPELLLATDARKHESGHRIYRDIDHESAPVD